MITLASAWPDILLHGIQTVKNLYNYLLHFQAWCRVAWSTKKRCYFVQWILREHILYVQLRCVAFMVHDRTHVLKSSPASIQDKNERLLHLFSSSTLPMCNPCNLLKFLFSSFWAFLIISYTFNCVLKKIKLHVYTSSICKLPYLCSSSLPTNLLTYFQASTSYISVQDWLMYQLGWQCFSLVTGTSHCLVRLIIYFCY